MLFRHLRSKFYRLGRTPEPELYLYCVTYVHIRVTFVMILILPNRVPESNFVTNTWVYLVHKTQYPIYAIYKFEVHS